MAGTATRGVGADGSAENWSLIAIALYRKCRSSSTWPGSGPRRRAGLRSVQMVGRVAEHSQRLLIPAVHQSQAEAREGRPPLRVTPVGVRVAGELEVHEAVHGEGEVLVGRSSVHVFDDDQS